jgi:hypothetical protein
MPHPLAFAAIVVAGVVTIWFAWVAFVAARRGRLGRLYRHHLRETRRERHFLASISFFITFAAVRYITWSIHRGTATMFHDVHGRSGLHIHHLVWGITLLLLVGYLWLSEIGIGKGEPNLWAARITCIVFGVAAALTLDEFALWLNLADVYWGPEGHASIRAVFYFGSLLSAGLWGRPFLHALTRSALRGWRHPRVARLRSRSGER